MEMRTAGDVGAGARDLRRSAGLSQAELAGKVGVSRQWIVDLEAGKRGVELGLVLSTFRALGVTLRAERPGAGDRTYRGTMDDLDIPDAAEVLARAVSRTPPG